MIVDDSMVARAVLSRMVETDGAFEIAAVAGTAEDAIDALQYVRVDVILLDLEMPGAGGLNTLPRIIEAARGARVMIVSSLAEDGAEETIAALAMGAADTLPKPGTGRFNGRFSEILVGKLRALGHVEHNGPRIPEPLRQRFESPLRAMSPDPVELLAIGASTGGIHALGCLFQALPPQIGIPILVTQHLPAPFMTRVCPPTWASPPSARPWSPRTAWRCFPTGSSSLQATPTSRSTLADGQLVARLDRKRSASGCLPSVDPMFASAAARARLRGHGRRPYRHGPRRGRGRDPAGRLRRLGDGPGRSQLRGLGHAARGRRSGPGLRGDAAREARPADRLSRGRAFVEVSDSSSRILAGLLEARTGQQLTMSRRWRIETALSSLLRERGISSLDELITILVMGKEPGLASRVVEALLNNETYFFRDRTPFDLLATPRPARAWPSAAHRRAGFASGRRAARPARKPIRWRCCSPKTRPAGRAGRSTSSAPTCRTG